MVKVERTVAVRTASPHRTAWLLFGCIFCAALLLYARTAAPSVLSGDSAEFQFVAPTLSVAHPTGYPLYTLLGWLYVTLLPVGDPAYRVTLVASSCAAGVVALVALCTLHLTRSRIAAGLILPVLACAPGLWHIAGIAEVYALHLMLIALLGFCLLRADNDPRMIYAAALVTGLGVSNHASFAFIAAPLSLAVAVASLWGGRQQPGAVLRSAGLLLICGLAGLSPWLYLFVRYAQLGPFDGLAHGLPRAYFWGAPTSIGAVVDHLSGGALRDSVFRPPDLPILAATLGTLAERLRFEFGELGLLLGLIGAWRLWIRHRRAALACFWVAGVTALYFASLGQAVQDALLFALPILPVWALWAGVGIACFAARVRPLRPRVRIAWLSGLAALLVLWASSRYPYGNKSAQWLFRDFGTAVLSQVEPNAVVFTRWEQGTILLYLQRVEGIRPDVRVDVSEPEDESWEARIRVYGTERPIYLIGSAEDAQRFQATPRIEQEYGALWRVGSPVPAPQ